MKYKKIAFDGIDGSGKTTLVNYFSEKLDKNTCRVYDGSVLKTIVSLIENHKSDKEIQQIIEEHKPLPDIVVVCRAPVDILLERLKNNGNIGVHDRMSLRKRIESYQTAIKKLKEFESIEVRVVNTDDEIDKVIEHITNILEQ